LQGYIKDFRKELDSAIWMMPPLYHRVWQYLKYKVNHQDRKIPMKDGSFLTINTGQHLTSLSVVAENVGWYERGVFKTPNKKTISDILEWLEKQSMIKIDRGKGNKQYTLITLLNWGLYQSKDGEGDGSEIYGGRPLDINENEKNDKNMIAAADNVPTTEESDGVPTTGPIEDDSESEEEISQTSEQAAQTILNRYIQLRASGFMHSPKDYDAAREIANAVPLESALIYLKECFDSYKPKHPRDKINSLSYCVGSILDKHTAEQEGEHGTQIHKHRRGYGRPATKSAEQIYRELEESKRAWGGS